MDFFRLFHRAPEAVATAPGRVNLMGEHTDYNDGLVLPTVLPQATSVAIAPRADDVVRIASADVGAPDAIERYELGREQPGRGWLDYVQGVTVALAGAGIRIGGFDASVASQIPIGAGLSSSAALEIALLRALRDIFALVLDDVALARLGQRAETGFVGARTGIMDQMAVSTCPPGAALHLDTRSLERRVLPLPDDLGLIVIHSGVAHDHAHGDYNQRRAECEAACRALGISSLRDLDEPGLPQLAALPSPLARRARHVITENARVIAACQALATCDGPLLGRLFLASHRSQRDDYEVSVPAVDRLVAIAEQDGDVLGARLTGGGFGGAVVMVAGATVAGAAARRVCERYERSTGQHARIVLPATIDDGGG